MILLCCVLPPGGVLPALPLGVSECVLCMACILICNSNTMYEVEYLMIPIASRMPGCMQKSEDRLKIIIKNIWNEKILIF